MAEKKITASFIVEILGRPPEHIKNALGELLDNFSKEKGVNLINKKIHEPKELENQEKVSDKQKLYTSFAEIEAEFENVDNLFVVLFRYMPSHVEIINPEEIILRNESLADLLTAISMKLHRYDEIAKKMMLDNQILEARLVEVLDAIKAGKKIEIVNENEIAIEETEKEEKKIKENKVKKKSKK